MRLIDADRLKDSIMLTCDLGGWIGDALLQIKKVAVKYIENAQTIDAVEVVRCKDCLMTKERDEYTNKVWCCRHREYMDDTYYCADGLREDGEA